jgi:hypothetical protein
VKKIIEGKPVPIRDFTKLCSEVGIGRDVIGKTFYIRPSNCKSPKLFTLSIKDMRQFNAIFLRFTYKDNNSKVNAALSGNSKRGKVNAGILNYFDNCSSKQGRTLLFEDSKCLTPPPKKDSIIIVENLSTFLNLSSEIMPAMDMEDTPVIYGKGGEIRSNQFNSFLAGYKKIICFFDYDLGGIDIYNVLHGKFGSKVIFYKHPELKRIIPIFGNALTETQIDKLASIAQTQESSPIITLMLNNKKWLEQEVLQSKNILA